jgi:hypothetical protein
MCRILYTKKLTINTVEKPQQYSKLKVDQIIKGKSTAAALH